MMMMMMQEAAAERLVAGASPQGIHEWAQRKVSQLTSQ